MTYVPVGVDDDNNFSPEVRQAMADSPEVSSAIAGSVAPDVDAVRINGDSLSNNLDASILATLLGVPVTKATYPGQASSDIALRAGALTVAVTVTGGTIPASGTVAASVSPATSFRQDGTGALTFSGVLALPDEPAVVLSHSLVDASWTIAQVGGVAPLVVPAGTLFRMPADDAYRGHIHTFWTGRNNFNPGLNIDDMIRDDDLLLRNIRGLRRCVVLGVTNALSEYKNASGTGTSVANYNAIVARNATLAARFGSRFLDIRRLLVDEAIFATGTTITPADLVDIARDTPPTSLHVAGDSIHFNTKTSEYIVRAIAQKMRTLGLIPGLIPYSAPGPVTSLVAGTVTSDSIAITWAAPAGAQGMVGSRIRVRRVVDSAWTVAGAVDAASGAFTVSGLVAGTPYVIENTPINEAGFGTPTTVTITTADSAPVVLFSDSFNGRSGALAGSTADGALGGSGFTWGSFSTNIRLTGTGVGFPTTADSSVRYNPAVDTGVATHRPQVTIADPSIASAGVVAAYTDANNYAHAFVNSNGSVSISDRVGGVSHNLVQSAAGVAVAGSKLSLKRSGSTLTAYINGVAVTSATTTLTGGTIAGIRTPSGVIITDLIDDFIVYDK